jgi:hypothetical protein
LEAITIGFFGFIFMIIGIIGAMFPRAAWYMSEGWKFKDAEPSDAALIMNRIMGIVFAIIGFFFMVSRF